MTFCVSQWNCNNDFLKSLIDFLTTGSTETTKQCLGALSHHVAQFQLLQLQRGATVSSMEDSPWGILSLIGDKIPIGVGEV